MQEFKKDPTWSKDTYQRVARETGLSESQVYKWGWDQKNKKNEEAEDSDDELDNGFDQEAQEEAEKKENENAQTDKKDDLKLQLDLAISQVVINNDELNHGIILPHKLTDLSNDSNLQKGETDLGIKEKLREKKASNESLPNQSSDSQKTGNTGGVLGKRPL